MRFLPVLLVVAGCATPVAKPGTVVDASGDALTRIQRVGAALAMENAALCEKTIGVVALVTAGKFAPPYPGAPDRRPRECRVGFRLMPTDIIGAIADGPEIILTSGLLRFARDDGELATIIAHRMGHMIAEHDPAPSRLVRLGAALGIQPARAPEPVFDAARELAADRISLFLLARAKFDPAVAIRFWRRVAAIPPGGNDWLQRHPVSAERIERMEDVAVEIETLRKLDQPIEP
jgi:Zn-dependent protease with chaperone function